MFSSYSFSLLHFRFCPLDMAILTRDLCNEYGNEYDENIQIQTHKYDRRIETIIKDIQDNMSEEMRCCEDVAWRRVGMGMGRGI